MKRRSLLTMFPAASALLAFRANGAPLPQPALTEAGFAISVQCWSFKEFTLFQAIEMAAAAGMGGVEVFKGQLLGGDHGDVKFGPDLSDEKVQAVIDHLKKNNLVAVNFGVTDISKDEAEARKTFELVFDRFFFRAAELAALQEGVREHGDPARPGEEGEEAE